MLDARPLDVVVMAHRGLEGFAEIRDIWSGGLVGSDVQIHFWRIPMPTSQPTMLTARCGCSRPGPTLMHGSRLTANKAADTSIAYAQRQEEHGWAIRHRKQ